MKVAIAMCVSVAVAMTGIPSVAYADQAGAQSLADQAYAAYQHESWSEAITLYLESYKQVPTAEILYNVAKIYDAKLKDKQLATEYYRRYTVSPDAEPTLVRRSVDRISELSREDKKSTPAPAQSTAPGADHKPAASTSSLKPVGFVVGAVGLAGLAAGGVFGGIALGQAHNAKSAGCSATTGCFGTAGADERNAASNGNISTAFFIAGGVLTAAGLGLVIFTPSSSSGGRDSTTTADSSPSTDASIRLTPSVGPGSVGLSLSGVLF